MPRKKAAIQRRSAAAASAAEPSEHAWKSLAVLQTQVAALEESIARAAAVQADNRARLQHIASVVARQHCQDDVLWEDMTRLEREFTDFDEKSAGRKDNDFKALDEADLYEKDLTFLDSVFTGFTE